MKIFIFCHDSYMSGANQSLFDWVSCDKDDEFVFCFPHFVKNNPFFNLSNSNIYYGNYFCVNKNLSSLSFYNVAKKFIKISYMKIFGPILKKRVKKIIKNENPQIILTNSFALTFGAEIAYELKIPHYWHIREFMELDHKITHYDQNSVKRLANYSYAIFISDVIKRYYKSKYSFKNELTVYDQIDLPIDFDSNKKLFKNSMIKVIIAGTLQENKGQKEAILAIKRVHELGFSVFLDIYGDGPQRNELRNFIYSNHLQNFVTLRGYSSKINEIRKNYDIELVCSSNEALGRVTIESMGCGCITIGANAGATADIINSNIGLLYELHNVNDLADSIIFAYKNADRMNNIRLNARNFAVLNFTKPIYKSLKEYFYVSSENR